MVEKFVEFENQGQKIRGMIHLPEDGQGKYPGVILLHGFTGNRYEPFFMFVRFSRYLAKKGIASLRFDFRCSGESEGTFEEMTISGEISDAEKALEFFENLKEIDENKIALVGLSMGGLVAACTSGRNSDKIKATVLWSAVGNMYELVSKSMKENHGIEDLAVIQNLGRISHAGLYLGKDFFRDLKEVNGFNGISKFKGNVLICHCKKDPVVPYEHALKYKEVLKDRAQLVPFEGSEHTFGKVEMLEKLFKVSGEFLVKELK